VLPIYLHATCAVVAVGWVVVNVDVRLRQLIEPGVPTRGIPKAAKAYVRAHFRHVLLTF
jgi:hypothetical protein